MVLYDAVCTADEARELLPRVAAKVAEDMPSADAIVEAERPRATKTISKRALGLLKLLGRRQCENIIRQLAAPDVSTRLSADFDGIVLQLIESGRWERKFGRTRVFDMVIAAPEFMKTIALSTTEIETAVPVDRFQIYDRLTLSNFHVYPFFNRAHAVRGREASRVDVGTRLQDLGRLRFLLVSPQSSPLMCPALRAIRYAPTGFTPEYCTPT